MDAGHPDPDPYFLHVKFDQRWECHRGTITRLYVDEKLSFAKLAEQMKREYRFDARYHLKKWDTTKNLKSSDKEKVITVLGKRAREGIDTGRVRHNGIEVDKKHLRRHLQASARQQPGLQLQGIVFGRWNLPYEALLRTTLIQQLNPPSPSRVVVLTPSDVSISPAGSPRQRNANDMTTPTTKAIIARTHVNRAQYLVEGRLQDLLQDMTAVESRTTINWLHHFWLFSFMSAKYWGKGPTRWSWERVNLLTLKDNPSLPNTPGSVIASPSYIDEAAANHAGKSSAYTTIAPSSLCRWTIHYREPSYERIPSPPCADQDGLSMDAPETWPGWGEGAATECLADRLKEAIEQNSFSDIERESLPISTTQIVQAVARSPEELKAESFGFAIMAQNIDALMNEFGDPIIDDISLSTLYPFHLAASYLSGGKNCCNMVSFLVFSTDPAGLNSIKRLYINDLGYTVLDCLMLSILKGHTSCTPAAADSQLPTTQVFSGEEIDLCGRWDADSTCVLALHRQGVARIPFPWKHVFCHTSAQAICHSINAIFSVPWSPDINTASGLFIKYCQNQNCKQKLTLLPLHTLVLVAFHLGNNGTEGETLFGILACLLCLLMNDANPLEKAEISLNCLLDIEEEGCSHVFMTPAELADKVPSEVLSKWSLEAQIGWKVFVGVLKYAVKERSGHMEAETTFASSRSGFETITGLDNPSVSMLSSRDANEIENEKKCCHWRCPYTRSVRKHFYGDSRELGKLWGSVQTELLTYRRIEEGDSWLSSNFDMHAVLQALSGHHGMDTLPLFRNTLIKPLCTCGRFWAGNDSCPIVDDACATYFSNMEDWSRSTFIRMPDS